MTARIGFAGVSLILPNEWCDVSQDLPSDTPPTLAKAEGVGALQFSTAKYKKGALPNIQYEDLWEFLRQLADSEGLGKPRETSQSRGVHPFVSGTFSSKGNLFRVWYISNGRDVTLVSYVASETESEKAKQEVAEAETIVASLDF